ncbi:MAG TPA: alkaline phosphatase family protein [Candidatus Angelobacter sp.]|nr:alkaline phosphatase family protein [Candidatus Angelobacter sp.]
MEFTSAIGKRMTVTAAILGVALSFAGCGGGSSANPQNNTATASNPNPSNPTTPSAITATLTATPATIQAGQSVTLTWSTTNATSVTINGLGTVSASGSQTVTPAQNVTYTITASGLSGSTQMASTTVTVQTTSTPGNTKTNGIPRSSHVVLVIEENHMFSEVYPSGMPWLSSMGNSYAFATNYHANEPGSALDYFWLSSGNGEQAFGCSGAGCTQPITSNNIFRELSAAGMTWKVYADSLPSVGYMGGDTGAYVDRHNPARWYSDVINNHALQQNIVPFTQFAADLAADRLPAYSIIIPDVNHDAHNGTVGQADAWLQANVAPLLKAPSFQAGGDGLLIVTYDECDGAVGACNQQVFTVMIGPNVKRGFQSSTFYQHQSTLRTILDALTIRNYPGASASAPDMADFFK